MIFWFINQYNLTRSFILIVEQFFGKLQANSAIDQAMYASGKLGLVTTLKTIFYLVFDETILYIFAGIAIYYILKEDLLRKKFAPIINCFISGSFLILFLFCFTVTHQADRFINLNFNIVLAPVLAAYFLYLNKRNQLKLAFLLSLILLATFFTIFSLYQSPLTMRANNYMTPSEYEGANWLICNKNPLISVDDIGNPICRYADFIYGLRFEEGRTDLNRVTLEFPDHFGLATTYDTITMFPTTNEKYLLFSSYDVESYTDVWKDTLRFNLEDFKKIDECKNVLKIFEDGGFRTYLIGSDSYS
jgi:hypothetical protein